MENKKLILNVGRQWRSGGRDIAMRLAEILDCHFYDKEIINLAAHESGLDEGVFERHDENKSFMQTIIGGMAAPFVTDSSFFNNNFSQENLFRIQSEAIRKAAARESCIFVGRCADYVLRDFENVLNIFITADKEDRLRRIAEIEGCTDEEKALKMLEQHDEQRSEYYGYYTGKIWGHGESYDLCINSSILGIEETTEYIVEFVKRKFKF